jgi:hypothetical protein
MNTNNELELCSIFSFGIRLGFFFFSGV